MAKSRTILVNLGTATAPEPDAVRRFLLEFLSDSMVVDYPQWFWQPVLRYMVLRNRPRDVAELYRTIWTDDGSPLDVGTRALTSAVQAVVGTQMDVVHAYRYGDPSVASCVAEGLSEGAESLSVVSLFPQRTGSTTGTIERLVADLFSGDDAYSRVSVNHISPTDPGYIAGMAEMWTSTINACGFEPEHLLLSFHGIPKRYDRKEGGLYRRDCEATTEAVLEAMNWPADRATLTYQSRFGPEPWIGPATDKTLEALPSDGISRVAVATPGFLTEGLETIEEIGIRAEESFREAGGAEFLRLPCIEANEIFVESLAKFILSL
jgi:protoporphyrin/coproporphyrin ferrochelatase